MSYNLKETLAPHRAQDDSLKTMYEEQKSLLSNFDVKGYDSNEPPDYGDEERPGPREHKLRRSMVVGIARGFIALVLGTVFLVSMTRSWCGRMGAANRLTDPSRLLSNGTHEFKRTVLIVSIDGLR